MISEKSGDSDFFANFQLNCAYATESAPGRIRNEDRYIFLAPGSVFAERQQRGYVFGVFDGCGGSYGGAQAAQLCADKLKYLPRYAQSVETTSYPALMERILKETNDEVIHRQQTVSGMENTACTATVLWLWEEEGDEESLFGHLMHIGDSRMYLIRVGEVRRLTTDHKIGHTLIGIIGMEPANFSPQSIPLRFIIDDLILMGTDGLWKPYDLDLLKIASGDLFQPQQIAQNWLRTARRYGSDDDQTAIVIKVS